MLYTDISQIDFNKYDRFFVVGCSFTNWFWPTWADVIAHDHPHLEFINLGLGGQGNQYIATAVSQIIQHYAPTSRDCVAVMWSTFHRISDYTVFADRADYLKFMHDHTEPEYGDPCNWRGTSDTIHCDKELHQSDSRGYLIRDSAYIHLVSELMKNAEFDCFQLFSCNPHEQNLYDTSFAQLPKDDVLRTYHSAYQNVAGESLLNVLLEVKNGVYDWQPKVNWIPAHGDVDDPNAYQQDHHPLTSHYCNYLNTIGYTVSNATLSWAEAMDERVVTTRCAISLIDNPDWPYKGYLGNQIL